MHVLFQSVPTDMFAQMHVSCQARIYIFWPRMGCQDDVSGCRLDGLTAVCLIHPYA